MSDATWEVIEALVALGDQLRQQQATHVGAAEY